MRKKQKSLLVLGIITAFVTSTVFLPVLIQAGGLEPSAPPGPTMKTLDEVYAKIESIMPQNGALPTSRSCQQSVIYMEVEGQSQGPIEGSCTIENAKGTIPVVGYEHDVHIPTDPQSGLPTGKRVHSPLSIIKYFDKASPKLYRALVTGEVLPKVTIRWYGLDSAGGIENFFTITLEDAIITTMRPYFPNFEGVSFTYRKIIWTWELDGIESSDDWRSPLT